MKSLIASTFLSPLLLLPLVLSSPVPKPPGTCNPKPHNVVDCIHKYKVEIVSNNSPDFQSAVHPFNTRLPWEPLAVTIPKTVTEVSIAVQCARIHKVKVAARSGGHSYGGYSLGGQDGSLVIDLFNFHDIKVDQTTGVATVGPGVRVGNLATALYENGKRGLAFGTCPGVGVGGHASHGGYGPHTRLWGALLDNIIKVEVVLADGSIVTASPESNPDLFWALRGAGSSFGIVTKFYFKTYPAPEEVYTFDLTLPKTVTTTAAGKVDLVLALQEFGLHAPKEIGLQIFYLNGTFLVSGMYFGTDGVEAESAIGKLADKLPEGAGVEIKKLPYLPTLMKAGMVTSLDVPVVGYNVSEAFFSTSFTTTSTHPMTREQLTPFFENLEPTNPSIMNAPITWLVLAELHGGGNSALTTKPQSSTSLAHRKETLFTWQFLGLTHDAQPPFPDSGIDFIHKIFSSITDSIPEEEIKGYANMFDATLTAEEAHRRYYGNDPWDGKEGSIGLYDRLVGLKHKYDPEFVFWNPQAIGA